MLESLTTVGSQVTVLFVLIFIGFLCARFGLLGRSAVDGMTDLVLYVVTPCIIIVSFQRPFNMEMLGALGIALVIALAFHLLNILFAHTLVQDREPRRRSVLRFGLVFSNAGYMSIPLQDAILGPDGVFYGAAVIAVFNIILWSYGLLIMSGDAKTISVRKLLFNPGITGVIIGVGLFLASVDLPHIVKRPMEMLSDLNTPLPMLIIGYYLSEATLSHVLLDMRVYMVLFLRLLAVPLILLAGLVAFGVRDSTLVVACVIAASAPCAAATTMFSSKFRQDTELSVGLVSFSTIVSIVTMPLVVALARHITA